MSISNLNIVDQVQLSTLIAVAPSSSGCKDRSASLDTVLTLLQNSLSPSSQFGSYTTQYSAPSATAFNITLTDGGTNNTNIHLILTPTGTFATGTLTLPAVASVVDKQDIIINTTQEVTALTVDGNGATAVTGEPSTLLANDFFRLKYDAPTSTWYRIG